MSVKFLFLAFIVAIISVYTFNGPYGRLVAPQRAAKSALTYGGLTMEYVPDGMSKEQWNAIKKKEKDALKGKNFGAVGITKFKSRSFEAWQKSGRFRDSQTPRWTNHVRGINISGHLCRSGWWLVARGW